jgi:hypothetical protein
MSVYVDPMQPCIPNERWPRRQVAHMWADTQGELHAMAARLSLRLKWHQPSKPCPSGHYDLTDCMRICAIRLGAIELTREQAVESWEELREFGPEAKLRTGDKRA